MARDDSERRLTIEAGLPAGAGGEKAPTPAAPRRFRVELLPSGVTREVEYAGERVGVSFD